MSLVCAIPAFSAAKSPVCCSPVGQRGPFAAAAVAAAWKRQRSQRGPTRYLFFIYLLSRPFLPSPHARPMRKRLRCAGRGHCLSRLSSFPPSHQLPFSCTTSTLPP
ncbi:hypothetical protein GQ54DRAFT_48161 [Martensiomyces pterosporus]|nr:hypothetical protein GQ54DRAFT_48161 [Martensiomyces pterosporus]